MLSYRHAFHAGNHSEMLKHVIVNLCLRHMHGREKPKSVLDAHGRAGMYAEETKRAKKTGEYIDGSARLWSRVGLPVPMRPYMDALRGGGGGLKLRL